MSRCLFSLLCALLVLAGHVNSVSPDGGVRGTGRAAGGARGDRANVVMIVDQSTYKGALLVMHSVLLSSADPRNIGFHLIVLPSADGSFNSAALGGLDKANCIPRQYTSNVRFKDWQQPSGYPSGVGNRGFDADYIYARSPLVLLMIIAII